MNSIYESVELEAVCSRITVGWVGPMADRYVPSGVPFLRSLNIAPFRLLLDDVKFIPEAFHHELSKSSLKPGDVAVVRTGNPGTACVIPASLPIANCSDLVVISPSDRLNPYFLAALFNSAFGQAAVSGQLVGVAQQHFNIGSAKKMRLALPPRFTQDRIASILSAYDDLIENNRKRIAILEDMAHRLYREWFVHFRYPGHEAVPLVESPLGRIPQGWEAAPASHMMEVLSGGTPKTDVANYWNGEIPFFTPKDAKGDSWAIETEKSLTEAGLNACNSRLYPRKTLFITARGTVGKLALAHRPMAMNQSCYALQPNHGVPPEYLFLAMSDAVAKFKAVAIGGVFDTIIVDTFSRIALITPPISLAAAITERVEPMLELVANLLDQIIVLRRTRDLLIPRLMSGQLSVEALATVEAAAP
jgi:type I restriction enzyme, S subunit